MSHVVRGVEHVALTVPDLSAAIAFFEAVLECEVYYESGPLAFPEGTWMEDNLDVHPRAVIHRLAMVRCGNGASFELFEFGAADQAQCWPRFSDWGGTHVAFYVDDIDAALARAEQHGARVLGGAKPGNGPEAGDGSRFAHFLTPWNQLLEFVTYPNGREYMKSGKPPLFRPEPVS